jgi:hypothetical protein
VSGRRPAVLVDIDGTVCIKHPDRDIYDLSRVGEDLPNVPVVRTVQAVRAAGYALVFCSGRQGTAPSRHATEAWLRAHVGEFEDLLMRPAGDQRPDDLVKHDLYRAWIEPFYDVLVAFDDRASVTKMWRDRCGLTVCQVAEGNY